MSDSRTHHLPPADGEAPALRPAPAEHELATLPPSAPSLPDPRATVGYFPGEPDSGATLPPGDCPPPAPPRVAVPGYEILGELGRGGMGVVYAARQASLNRRVALKMILSGGHAGQADLARFRTEAESIARLQHPNIVQVFEVGSHDGWPYLALEFCAGGSLERKLNGTPLPPREAAALAGTLAGAVHAAHKKGVVHRDLKPANVLLAEDGTPKITDFGLAKKLDEAAGPTQSGSVMGTPSYMAPEQAGGKKQVGPAADVYALGAVLYELLTGRPPFKAATPLDTILLVLNEEPVPPARLNPKVPRDLETICLTCLHKDPAKRYASAEELAADLGRFRADEPIRARPEGAVGRMARWVRRKPREAALLVLLALVLLGGLTGVVVEWRRAVRGEESARTQEAAALEQKGAAEREKEEAERQKARAQTFLHKAVAAVDRLLDQAGDDQFGGTAPLQGKRRRLLEDAAEFYKGLLELESADSLLRRQTGRTYFRSGRLLAALGKDAESQGAYEKARALQERLAAEFPAEPGYRNDLAETLRLLAHAHRAQGRNPEAHAALAEAERIGAGLTRDHPTVADYRVNYARTRTLSGLQFFQEFRLPDAERELRGAVDLLGAAPEGGPPAEQAAAGDCCNTLGFFYLNTGRYAQAEPPLRRALAAFEGLGRDDPDHAADHAAGLARVRMNLGVVLANAGRGPEAEGMLAEGVAAYERLVRDYPEAPANRYLLAAGQFALSLVYHEAGRYAEAAGRARQALDLLEKLAREHPQIPYYGMQVRPYRFQLGLAELGRGDAKTARAAFAESLGEAEAQLGSGASAFQAIEVCSYYWRRSRQLERLGRLEDAAADLDRAAKVAESLPKNQPAGVFTPEAMGMARCCLLARAGRHAEAVAAAAKVAGAEPAVGDVCYNLACVHALAAAAAKDEKLLAADRGPKAEAYAAKAVALLSRCRELGYFKDVNRRAHLDRDDDLKALRVRDDYKAFVESLGK